MCQSIADGGRRCSGTPTGRAINKLYMDRRANPDRAQEITARIEQVREAERLYGGRFVTPFEMPLPDGVPETLDVIRTMGNPLIVGGAVRDVTVGADIKDIDIEVHGTTLDELSDTLKRNGYHVDEVGKQFGVLKVSKRGGVTDLDIAVPRRENAVGAGHRDFEVTYGEDMTVTDAAERRDFTINAMAFDPRLGVLVDPFNGAADLESKTLRAVSDKFAEDPLRVLRGVQFAGRFGLDIDPKTASMCRDLRPQYTELAKERVADEWMKLYTKGVHADAALRVLKATGWDDTLPGLREAVRDESVVESLSKLRAFLTEERASVGAALMSRNMPEHQRREFISKSTVGNDTARLANALVETDPSVVYGVYESRVIARAKAKSGWTWGLYHRYAKVSGNRAGVVVAESAMSHGLTFGPQPPLVQGRDILVRVDRKPGPWLGKLVEETLDRQYRGEFADNTAALEWAVSQALSDD